MKKGFKKKKISQTTIHNRISYEKYNIRYMILKKNKNELHNTDNRKKESPIKRIWINKNLKIIRGSGRW